MVLGERNVQMRERKGNKSKLVRFEAEGNIVSKLGVLGFIRGIGIFKLV